MRAPLRQKSRAPGAGHVWVVQPGAVPALFGHRIASLFARPVTKYGPARLPRQFLATETDALRDPPQHCDRPQAKKACLEPVARQLAIARQQAFELKTLALSFNSPGPITVSMASSSEVPFTPFGGVLDCLRSENKVSYRPASDPSSRVYHSCSDDR